MNLTIPETIMFTILCFSVVIRCFAVLMRKDQTNYTCRGRSGEKGADNLYRFRLKKIRGKYRCYILRTPSYRGRPTGATDIHYYTEGRRRYICFTGDIRYLAQAKTLCRSWSDMSQRYIETGKAYTAP